MKDARALGGRQPSSSESRQTLRRVVDGPASCASLEGRDAGIVFVLGLQVVVLQGESLNFGSRDLHLVPKVGVLGAETRVGGRERVAWSVGGLLVSSADGFAAIVREFLCNLGEVSPEGRVAHL